MFFRCLAIVKQIAKNFRKVGSMAAFALLIGFGVAKGQTPAIGSSNEITSQPANLIEATNQYKASSKELLTAQQTEIGKAEAKLLELRQLVADGLVARAELEAEEQKLVALRQLPACLGYPRKFDKRQHGGFVVKHGNRTDEDGV